MLPLGEKTKELQRTHRQIINYLPKKPRGDRLIPTQITQKNNLLAINVSIFNKFIKIEASSSIILIAATLLALVFANSPWQHFYFLIFNQPLLISINHIQLSLTGIHFINDDLMTIFFLLVSLEVKRELLIGELNSRSKALLPVIAATGGMLVPALIYIGFNHQNNNVMHGWAIPTATDIAFSLAILQLLGSRIPSTLKSFLMALAIIDDLGAIIIIALFYTTHIYALFLLLALLCLIILLLLNYFNVSRLLPYAIVGILLWACIIKSGIHATIAGVILGFTIPLHSSPLKKEKHSLLKKLEHNLHPWNAYLILPLFAFANAGLSFDKVSTTTLFNPLLLSIAAGLFIGKPIGVLSATWLAIKSKCTELPKNIHWQQLLGVSLLCGIGFTMSLFIGTLAFNDSETLNLIRLGVLSGSLLSAIAGYWVLKP
jgi:NhaA family Na+:H+ antiporter